MAERWLGRLGGRLEGEEPPADLWERVRHREVSGTVEPAPIGDRLSAGLVAIAIVAGIALGGWVLLGPARDLARVADDVPGPVVGPPPTASTSPDQTPGRAADKAPPDCGRVDLTGNEYGTEIRSTSGPPGTEVIFSGTTLRGGDGRWAAADRLEAWWNTEVPATEVPGGRPLRDGPVLKLVEVHDMERCEFETSFTIPDVEPGRYQISVFVWYMPPEHGYGFFLPHEFTVTTAVEDVES